MINYGWASSLREAQKTAPDWYKKDRYTCAPWLRGFVRFEGYNSFQGRTPKKVYRWGVYNKNTGKILTSDNTCCDLERAIWEAERLVGAARVAWMHSYNLKDLR